MTLGLIFFFFFTLVTLSESSVAKNLVWPLYLQPFIAHLLKVAFSQVPK